MIQTSIYCENKKEIEILAPLMEIRNNLKILPISSLKASFDDFQNNTIVIFVLEHFLPDLLNQIKITARMDRYIIFLVDEPDYSVGNNHFPLQTEYIQKSKSVISQILFLIRTFTIKLIMQNASYKLTQDIQNSMEVLTKQLGNTDSDLLKRPLDSFDEFYSLINDYYDTSLNEVEEINFIDVMDQLFVSLEPLLSDDIEIDKQFSQSGMLYGNSSLLNKAITSLLMNMLNLSSTFRSFIFSSTHQKGIPGIQESVLSLKIELKNPFQANADTDFFTRFTNLIENNYQAYFIVAIHYGEIIYNPKPESKITLEILLPSHSKITGEKIKKKKKINNILVVDDEDIIRELIVDVLPKSEYHVLTASDGKEGLDIYKKNQKEIDLVILDVVMPKMDGKELYDAIRKIKKDIKVVITSGYSKTNVRNKLALSGVNAFLPKPFVIDDLVQLLKKILC